VGFPSRPLNIDRARDAFLEFLAVTRSMLTPEIEQARSEAEAALRDLGR
jgi:hypothetical protein